MRHGFIGCDVHQPNCDHMHSCDTDVYHGLRAAQEVERLGPQPQGCWFDPQLLIASRVHRVSRCPWARPLNITSPDEHVVAIRGGHRCRCVSVCMNG